MKTQMVLITDMNFRTLAVFLLITSLLIMIASLAPQVEIFCVVRNTYYKGNVLKLVRINFLRFNAFQSNTFDLHDVFLNMSNDLKTINSSILIIHGICCSLEYEIISP